MTPARVRYGSLQGAETSFQITLALVKLHFEKVDPICQKSVT